ncbi:hypothetical protein ACCO45_005437 [Purpureocillium lilacinum]|uniref:Uncharacterized protein n=1 Tax=Purpureocillium lilacinum TaxID=33203 RepID=A0ACC4DYA5_PURLI
MMRQRAKNASCLCDSRVSGVVPALPGAYGVCITDTRTDGSSGGRSTTQALRGRTLYSHPSPIHRAGEPRDRNRLLRSCVSSHHLLPRDVVANTQQTHGSRNARRAVSRWQRRSNGVPQLGLVRLRLRVRLRHLCRDARSVPGPPDEEPAVAVGGRNRQAEARGRGRGGGGGGSPYASTTTVGEPVGSLRVNGDNPTREIDARRHRTKLLSPLAWVCSVRTRIHAASRQAALESPPGHPLTRRLVERQSFKA